MLFLLNPLSSLTIIFQAQDLQASLSSAKWVLLQRSLESVKRKLFCPSSLLGGSPETLLSSVVHVYTWRIRTALCWGRGSLNKSVDYFGEDFGAEGSSSGVERGNVYCCTGSLKKIKIGRQVWHSFCCTSSMFELVQGWIVLGRDFQLILFPCQRIHTILPVVSRENTLSLFLAYKRERQSGPVILFTSEKGAALFSPIWYTEQF